MNLRETGKEILISLVTNCTERIEKMMENLEATHLICRSIRYTLGAAGFPE